MRHPKRPSLKVDEALRPENVYKEYNFMLEYQFRSYKLQYDYGSALQ